MSLLLLKTRDLTWQDHTLNTEVMLAPTRSGLLLNKHKTLGARCEMDKQLYERQRAQCLKDFLTGRRMIDRQRQRLVQRQRELDTKHVRACSAAGNLPSDAPGTSGEVHKDSNKERSASAPSGARAQKGLPVIVVPSGAESPDPSERSSGIFVTEIADPFPVHRNSRTSISTTTSAPADMFRKSSTPSTLRSPMPWSRKKSPVPPGRKPRDSTSRDQKTSRGQKTSPEKKAAATSKKETPASQPPPVKRTISVRFPDTLRTADDDDEDDDDESSDPKVTTQEPTLEEKVRVFLSDIENFSARTHSEREANREAWLAMTKRRRNDVAMPLVAKRYNTWQVDQAQLLAAFDDFCQNQTVEGLTRAMRIAAKMKASVKVTRNQSIVPSIATFKSTRAFKALLNRQAERAV